MKIKKGKDSRGFSLYSFEDTHGNKCSFQESSNAEKECIWLGGDEIQMHLDRKMCKKLGELLLKFANEGWEMFDKDRKDLEKRDS